MGSLDDLTKDLQNLSRQAQNINKVRITITATDTEASVTQKLKAEFKRQNAYEFTDKELREMARDELKKARR